MPTKPVIQLEARSQPRLLVRPPNTRCLACSHSCFSNCTPTDDTYSILARMTTTHSQRIASRRFYNLHSHLYSAHIPPPKTIYSRVPKFSALRTKRISFTE